MNKEDLYKSIASPNCVSINRVSIGNYLDEFFESNVCIPKGENRHPHAEVLHAWIEGSEVEFSLKGQWISFSDVNSVYDEGVRIKPSEPIYEWQWFEVYDGKVADYTTVWYTEEEMNDENQWLKIEETKRIRQ